MTLVFWASTETHRDAYPAVRAARQLVEPFLNEAFKRSSLADFDGKIRYVPIVMPPEIQERYPARSRVLRKERIVDPAPQLNYQCFLSGLSEEALAEYLAGLRESADGLRKLGATEDQTNDYLAILERAFAELRHKLS